MRELSLLIWLFRSSTDLVMFKSPFSLSLTCFKPATINSECFLTSDLFSSRRRLAFSIFNLSSSLSSLFLSISLVILEVVAIACSIIFLVDSSRLFSSVISFSYLTILELTDFCLSFETEISLLQ